jgi:lipoic acid synthetase
VLRVRTLGTVPYHEADTLQHALANGTSDDYLLILEHPPTYTLGAHADGRHVLVDPAEVGAVLHRVDRGGDVTYHGPGQLVAYPVVTIAGEPGAGPAHVHRLERVVIDTLADLGLAGATVERDYPGVWITSHSLPRKIAAVGVRAVRTRSGLRRTLHGVALNVSTDLAMFSHIVPCGITGRGVTSLRAEGINLPMDTVLEAFVARAVAAFGDGEVQRSDVVTGPAAPAAGPAGGGEQRGDGAAPERALLRRLRQAGVSPDEGLAITTRKPDWVRVPLRTGSGYRRAGATIHDLGLVTVCEEAGCPNIYECWAAGTATFMINGDRCTRACGFCQVDTRHPLPLSPDEPSRVAEAVERMHLDHAVITCVARDDLADGGAGAMAATIRAVRARRPQTAVEVLISDCRGDPASLDAVFEAGPDILNHNIETVARLQRAVRPSAGYARSLAVLARARAAGLLTKSGMMVGLGEREDEVVATMADLRAVGVSIVTIGQYLRPGRDHLPVSRYWRPGEFDRLRRLGTSLGLAHVEASPLTRSSYHAREAASAAEGSHVRHPVSIRA